MLLYFWEFVQLFVYFDGFFLFDCVSYFLFLSLHIFKAYSVCLCYYRCAKEPNKNLLRQIYSNDRELEKEEK